MGIRQPGFVRVGFRRAGAGSTGAVQSVSSFAGGVAVSPTTGNTVIAGSANATSDAANWASRQTWSVDPGNSTGLASDGNTGADDAHPLLTMAELASRISRFRYTTGGGTAVRLLSDMLDADSAYFNTTGTGTASITQTVPFPVAGFLTIVGIPTVVYSGAGTVASPSQATKGQNADNHFTDGAAPAFSNATGRLWAFRTQLAASSQGRGWPTKDLTGGVWRTSQIIRNFANAAVVAGDSWQILQLPKLKNVSFEKTFDLTQYHVALCDIRTTNSPGLGNQFALWDCCDFTSVSAGDSFQGDFYNCRNPRFNSVIAPASLVSGGSVDLNGFVGVPAGVQVTYLGNANTYCSFNSGVPLAVDNGASVPEANVMFYDNTTAMITLVDNSRFAVSGSGVGPGGLNNTGKIIDITGRGASAALNNNSLPPGGLTSDGSPYRINSFSSATVPFVDLSFMSSITSAGGGLSVANAAVACVFTANVGPTGANTAIQRWVKLPDGGGGFFTFPSWT